jgi:pimeloyl-ACP methyl ester carboxylesterase
MGGKTAMLLACRHPARVARLVVVDVAPKNYSWTGHRNEFLAMNELNLAQLTNRAEAEERFAARVPDLGMRKFLATNLERESEGRWRWSVNLAALTKTLPQLEQEGLAGTDKFEGPALFIVGGRSNYVHEEDHAAIRRHFPAARIIVLPEAGHNPHMDSREAFVRAILA